MAKIGTFDTTPGSDADPIPVVIVVGAPVVNAAEAIAPAAAAVIADSGQLAAGVYYVEILMGFSAVNAAGKHISAERRDAANGATLTKLGLCPGGASVQIVIQRIVVAQNERIRAVIGAVAGEAVSVAQAAIRVYPLAA